MKLKTEMLQEEYAQALEAEKHATVEKSIKMKEQHAATLEKLKQEGKYRLRAWEAGKGEGGGVGGIAVPRFLKPNLFSTILQVAA